MIKTPHYIDGVTIDLTYCPNDELEHNRYVVIGGRVIIHSRLVDARKTVAAASCS